MAVPKIHEHLDAKKLEYSEKRKALILFLWKGLLCLPVRDAKPIKVLSVRMLIYAVSLVYLLRVLTILCSLR